MSIISPREAVTAVLLLADSLDQHATEVADKGEALGLTWAARRIREVVAAGAYPDEETSS